jgi:hypothetical protein
LGCFVKYQLAVDAWVYISLGLLFWSIGLPVCFCANTMLYFCCGSVYNLKSGIVMPPALDFFAQNCFDYLRSFVKFRWGG